MDKEEGEVKIRDGRTDVMGGMSYQEIVAKWM
jgi:hypothetical protein